MRKLLTILFTALPLILMSSIAFALDDKNNLVDKIYLGYIDSAMVYGTIFYGYAVNLFWWFVLLDLAFKLVHFYKGGEGDFAELIAMFIYQIIYAGFFFLILENGAAIANFIYDVLVNDFGRQMIDTGVGATGWSASTQTLSPTDFLDIGFSICFAITEKAGFWSKTGFMINMVALVMIVLFMLIIAEILVAMVEFYMTASIGYFLLAFGGISQGRDVVWNYFKTLFALAFKIMTVYAVTTIAFGFIQQIAGTGAQREAIVADTESLLVLLAGVGLFAILVRRVPGTIVGIITGAMGGAGGVVAGAGAMLNTAVAAAAGAAAGAIAGTGGAANATAAAAKLAKAQTSGGGGGASSTMTSAAGGSSGGMGTKVAATMGGAMSFGGNMAKNLVSSAAKTANEKGFKGQQTFSSFAGAMTNSMNKTTAENQASSDMSSGGLAPPTMDDVNNVLKGNKKS